MGVLFPSCASTTAVLAPASGSVLCLLCNTWAAYDYLSIGLAMANHLSYSVRCRIRRIYTLRERRTPVVFGNVRKLIAWNKLGLQLSKLQGAFQQYQKDNQMTWKQNLLKMGKHLLIASGSIAASAILTWLASPAALDIISKDLTPAIGTALYPIIHSLAEGGLNYFTKMGPGK